MLNDLKLTPAMVLGVILTVAIMWLLTPLLMYAIYPGLPDRAQAGDVFGSVNALFSGLVFAGVIIAIMLQREELILQREQLSRAATAQEESRAALQSTIYAHAYKTAVDILQAPEVREARRVVQAELATKSPKDWTATEIAAAEIVSSTYDTVAIMTKYDILPLEYVADNWGDSLVRSWGILAPFIEQNRSKRAAMELWDDCERLAQEARKLHERKRAAPVI